MPIDTPLFTVSAVLAVVIGFAFLWNVTQKWRQKENALNKPMTITLRTEKTPAELIAEANAARVKRWFTYGVVLILVWAFLKLQSPELAVLMEQLLFGVISALVRGLAALFSVLAELMS